MNPFRSYKKKLSHWLYKRFKLNLQPSIKVYHGYAGEDQIHIYGHVLRVSPYKQERFTKNFWHNATSLVRLFMVEPYANAQVFTDWQGQRITTHTADDGFFHLEWKPEKPLTEGWHDIAVHLADAGINITGQGKVFVPGRANIALVSDIDDTFLMSFSSVLRKRLYVLFTKNARARKPFEGVVKHYQMLVSGDKEKNLRPFFYVSSSEWNLYDYISEFSQNYKIPDGIYLLNQIKSLDQLLESGQNNHTGKFVRIVRLLTAYPDKQFVLFGDDSQEDPNIYYHLAQTFPDRIRCIYIRHVRSSRLEIIKDLALKMKNEGREFYYFKHSQEAIEHSKRIGLI